MTHPKKPQDAGELVAFDVYFASIRSMQFHPGANTRGHVVLDVKQCAEEAMEMLSIRREILNRED